MEDFQTNPSSSLWFAVPPSILWSFSVQRLYRGREPAHCEVSASLLFLDQDWTYILIQGYSFNMSESTDLKLALLNVYRCDVSDWCWPGVQVVVTRCESITWTTQWAIYLPRVVHHRLICWERMTSLCLLLIYYFWISNKNQNINCVLQLSSRQNQERRSWSWSFSSLMTVSSTLI